MDGLFGRGCIRDGGNKSGCHIGLTFESKIAAVPFYDSFDNCQSQAGAFLACRACLPSLERIK